MKNKLLTIILGLTVSWVSMGQIDPNKNIDEGKVEGNIYTSQEIGWTIAIPTGWTLTEKAKLKEMNEKGLKVLEETIEESIDYSELKNLIAFEKNVFNNFQSTSEPFALEYDGEWEENNAAIKDVIYQAYVNQGIKVDSTATKIETIDNLDFQTYTFTIYGPEGNVILKQRLFSRLINGFDFGVIINYNNFRDGTELLNIFRKSKFKK
jgi:hypothetical protein